MTNKITYIILTLMGLCACSKKGEVDTRESITINYNARKCNYAWADNVKSELVVVQNVSAYLRNPLKKGEKVKISEYTLALNTCDIDISDFPTEYQEYFNSDRYNPLYLCPFMEIARIQKNYKNDQKDVTIENKIHQFLIRNNPNLSFSKPQARQAYVDYRTEPITGLEITCSEPIFGVEAGKSLNDYFEIVGYPQYHNFIVTTNKQLVTAKIQDISISQYLSYAPLAPSGIYFQIKKGSINDKITAKFTINLEINGTKKISATTNTIILEP